MNPVGNSLLLLVLAVRLRRPDKKPVACSVRREGDMSSSWTRAR